MAILIDEELQLDFVSGITVKGILRKITRKNGTLQLLSFSNCTVTDANGAFLFKPSWGMYDMAVGEKITSVYSGTADKDKFDIFPVKSDEIAIEVEYKDKDKRLFQLYNELRKIRGSNSNEMKRLKEIYDEIDKQFQNDWLIRLELFEIIHQKSYDQSFQQSLRDDLELLRTISAEYDGLIQSGLELITDGKS